MRRNDRIRARVKVRVWGIEERVHVERSWRLWLIGIRHHQIELKVNLIID